MLLLNASRTERSPDGGSTYDLFAHFFHLWLRKHGFLHAPFLGSATNTDFVVVPSLGLRRDALHRVPNGFFDGPLDSAFLDDVGIDSEEFETTAVFVSTKDRTLSSGGYFAESDSPAPVGYRAVRTAPRQANAESFVASSASRGLAPERFVFQTLKPTGSWEVLLWGSTMESPRDKRPIVLADGKRIVSGLPLMALLGSKHATFDLEDAYLRTDIECFNCAFEVWFRNLLLETCRSAGVELATFNPWPAGFTSSFTLRHDYDRAIPGRHLSQLLDVYERVGLKTSVGFLKRLCPRDQMRHLADRGHEAALHSEASSRNSFLDEVRHHEEIAGKPPAGVTFHGGTGALGIRGGINIRWAQEAGLAYAETYLRTGGMHRVGYFEDKSPRLFETLGLPFHITFDYSLSVGDFDLSTMRDVILDMLGNGLHVTLMNHPDLYSSHLLAFLQQLDLSGVWCATHQEIVAWASGLDGLSVELESGNMQFSLARPLAYNLRLTVHSGHTARNVQLNAGERSVECGRLNVLQA